MERCETLALLPLTRFGPVTLRLAVDEHRRFELTIATDPDWRRKPSTVAVHLPAGSTLDIDGKPITATGPIPVPWQTEMKIRGEFSQLTAQ